MTSGAQRILLAGGRYASRRVEMGHRFLCISHRRAEGAKALAYFKSDENIALVRPLLNDPGVTYLQPAGEGKAGERLFGVRHSAYETLKAWGIDEKQRVFREVVPYERR